MDENKTTSVHKFTKKQLRYLPVKRAISLVFSTGAIIVLSPILVGIAIAIKIDSPGPVLFKQKRVGKNKELFEIYKFRTMYTNTPSDKPTHMLLDSDQHITRMGRILRRSSCDELPQLFNIWKGQMYIVSTRPALWNQYDLMEERDKYGVHAIAPGLSGWAQINGRDELEIPVKAKFDGEYIEKLSLWMDVKCLLSTIGSVLMHDGVVEGGTEKMFNKEQDTSVVSPEKIKKEIAIGGAVAAIGITVGLALLEVIIKYLKNKMNGRENINTCIKSKLLLIIYGAALVGVTYTAYVNAKRKVILQDTFFNDNTDDEFNVFENDDMLANEKKVITPKKILITGANSFIGMSVEKWLREEPDRYIVNTIDMIGDDWKRQDFSQYDVVYHVAGIAHVDVGSVSDEQKQLYYKVNTKLTTEVVEKAKEDGVKQFIFMSSMIVYSGCKEKIITSDTKPNPLNFYGDSKWQADQKVRELETPEFKVVVLRPPMIYGKGSKGNYPQLAKISNILPVFPIVKNKRSMLHIDNLCQFIRLMIDNEESGVFFPQNGEYTNTSDMVQLIASVKGHFIIMLPFTNLLVRIMSKIPGKIGDIAYKAFGDLAYSMEMSEYKENYRVNSLKRSIELTEGEK